MNLKNMPAAMMVALVNALTPPKDQGENNEPNVVCVANAARYVEANLSTPLTAYARGYRDPENIEQTLDFVAPRVPAPKRFSYRTYPNAEQFYMDTDDLRAPGGPFKRVEYTGDEAESRLLNRGLTLRIDHDNVEEGDTGWQEREVARLMQRLRRNSLYRVIAALSAAATNTAKTWDTTAGKNPDGDVRAELITAADITGIRPNRVLYGDTAWDKRTASHEAQNNAQGYNAAGRTPEQLASFLGVKGVRVSRERYYTGSALAQVVNNLVLMFFALDGANQDDASNIKRFVSQLGGGDVRVYVEEKTKWTDLTVETYERILIPATTGIRQFTVS